MTENFMNYHRARLIIECHLMYDVKTIREACVWMLGSLDATDEDCMNASYVLATVN